MPPGHWFCSYVTLHAIAAFAVVAVATAIVEPSASPAAAIAMRLARERLAPERLSRMCCVLLGVRTGDWERSHRGQ